MRLKTALMGAAATLVFAPAAFAERGADGQLNLFYWQAPSILNPYLSSGTKDLEASSMVIEPLARYNPAGELVPYIAAEVPTVANGGIAEDTEAGVIASTGTYSAPAEGYYNIHWRASWDGELTEPGGLIDDVNALMAHDKGDDVDLVIGLVTPLSTFNPTFSALGRANVLGRHIVMRSTDAPEEMAAFEQALRKASAEARADLYQARLRHKETLLLLHEVGHILGAPHLFHHFPFPIDEEEGGEGGYRIGLAESKPFAGFHVQFHIDEVAVVELTDFFVGKYFPGHAFAGPAPGGIGIDEDDFFLLFCFLQRFFPTAVEKLNTLAECRACRQRHQRNNYPQFHNDILKAKR